MSSCRRRGQNGPQPCTGRHFGISGQLARQPPAGDFSYTFCIQGLYTRPLSGKYVAKMTPNRRTLSPPLYCSNPFQNVSITSASHPISRYSPLESCSHPRAVSSYPTPCVGIGKLTTLSAKNLTKPGRHGDADGLYLNIAASGSKSWVQRSGLD